MILTILIMVALFIIVACISYKLNILQNYMYLSKHFTMADVISKNDYLFIKKWLDNLESKDENTLVEGREINILDKIIEEYEYHNN